MTLSGGDDEKIQSFEEEIRAFIPLGGSVKTENKPCKETLLMIY